MPVHNKHLEILVLLVIYEFEWKSNITTDTVLF